MKIRDSLICDDKTECCMEKQNQLSSQGQTIIYNSLMASILLYEYKTWTHCIHRMKDTGI